MHVLYTNSQWYGDELTHAGRSAHAHAWRHMGHAHRILRNRSKDNGCLQDTRKMLSTNRLWQAKMYISGLILTAVLLSFAQLARAQAGSTTSPLFNFTRQGSETLLASSDDGSSGAISTSAPFVFYGSIKTTLFVSLICTDNCTDLRFWLSMIAAAIVWSNKAIAISRPATIKIMG